MLSTVSPKLCGMPRPSSVMHWTPGSGGAPEPPTVEDLTGLLMMRSGPPGIQVEQGKPSSTGMPVVNAVARDKHGEPFGILQVRMLGRVPGIVDVAVDERHRRYGVALRLAVALYHHGIDLRDAGAIWDGPLTRDGERFRDAAVKYARDVFGPASWERGEGVG